MKNARNSLRNMMIITFIVISVCITIIIGYISFAESNKVVKNNIKKMEDDSAKEILNKVDEFVKVPLFINQSNYNLIKNGIVNIDDKREREIYFSGVMISNLDNIYSFSYGTENGEYYGSRRNLEGTIEIQYIKQAYLDYKKNLKDHAIVKIDYDKLHIKVSEYKNEGLDWLIITSITESQFTNKMSKNIYKFICSCIVLLVICIILCIERTKCLVKPINDLIRITENFSKGDLSERAEVVKNDEVGRLSQAFNNMAEKLCVLIYDLKRRKLLCTFSI